MKESAVERLIKTNPDMEIWWDSSPLIFDQWVQKLVNAAEPARNASWKEQLVRLYNAETPGTKRFPRLHHQPAPLLGSRPERSQISGAIGS